MLKGKNHDSPIKRIIISLFVTILNKGVNRFELPMGLRSTTATYNKGQSVTNTSAWSSRWAIPPIILSLDLDLRDFVADVSIIHVHRSQFIYLWDHWLQNALYSTLICFKLLGKCQFPLSFFHKTLEMYFWCSNIILITKDQCFFSGFFYLLCL